jgi:hypothetical protein
LLVVEEEVALIHNIMVVVVVALVALDNCQVSV